MPDEDEFSWQYLDDAVNVPDAIKSAVDGNLLSIVSQSDGGIIAYAIGREHAEQIVEALILYKETEALVGGLTEGVDGPNT